MTAAGPVIRTLASVASPGGPRARLSILIFHRVLPEADPLRPGEVTRHEFHQRVAFMKRHFRMLPLSEAVDRLTARSLPARAAAITFDDGYRDNAEVALPVLQELGVPATFFIATAFLDGGMMWNDRVIEAVRHAADGVLDLEADGLGRHPIRSDADRMGASRAILSALKYRPLSEREERSRVLYAKLAGEAGEPLMMSSDQVRGLHDAGMEIGGHTARHPILARLDDRQAREEIGSGKEALEALLREPIHLFAYPNGRPDRDYGQREVDLVRSAGFAAAVTTSAGSADASADRFQLPRFTPWDRALWRFGARLIANYRDKGMRASAPTARARVPSPDISP